MSEYPREPACRNEDPELFFPIGNSKASERQAEEAKAVCDACLVREECLERAFEIGDPDGIWGGMTQEERRGHKRRSSRMGNTAINS